VTASVLDVVLADLEHHPDCVFPWHTGDQPASLWLDKHGCEEGLICANCLDKLHAWWARAIRITGRVRCPHCGERFESFDAAYRVISL
jgi:hypothetical protein